MRRVTIRVALAASISLVAAPAFAGGPGSPATLEGHVSFLASDLLAGRDTPSIGLDVAAEYIASNYRRIGLKPVGDDGYFQTAPWTQQYREAGDLSVVVGAGPGAVLVDEADLAVIAASDAVSIERASAVSVAFDAPGDVEVGAWRDRVVLTRLPSMTSIPRDERRAFFEAWQAFARVVQQAGAAAVVSLEPDAPAAGGVAGDVRRGMSLSSAAIIRITGANAQRILDAGEDARLSINLAPVRERTTPVRNVVGLLEGSDPALAAEHVIVSAHYDHVGRNNADGDNIFNGANDNASGTAGVIEIAALLAAGERPKRSVLFICYYGEEKGLIGARFYAENPVLPLADAVANINLEQIGRTDDVSGDVAKRIMPTGAGFSTALDPIREAAVTRGVEMAVLEPQTIQYFRASDNVALAAKGVPAHTICTAFSFPEYHQPGDHWNLLDYDNMSLIVATLADGVARLAEASAAPEWIERDETRAFIRARAGEVDPVGAD